MFLFILILCIILVVFYDKSRWLDNGSNRIAPRFGNDILARQICKLHNTDDYPVTKYIDSLMTTRPYIRRCDGLCHTISVSVPVLGLSSYDTPGTRQEEAPQNCARKFKVVSTKYDSLYSNINYIVSSKVI